MCLRPPAPLTVTEVVDVREKTVSGDSSLLRRMILNERNSKLQISNFMFIQSKLTFFELSKGVNLSPFLLKLMGSGTYFSKFDGFPGTHANVAIVISS